MSTVYPADIRGLVTTLLFSVGRLPLSTVEDLCKPHSVVEGYAQPGFGLFPGPAFLYCPISILCRLLYLPCDGPCEGTQFPTYSRHRHIGILPPAD